MDLDARDATEARYELVISVDARRSGEYDDVEKPRMRQRIYRVLETAFSQAKVGRDAVHLEDRGDGVLASVAGRVAVTRLLGLWLLEVHETLQDENRALRNPLGLRIGMHVGPVRHDERGISGRAVDLACRLADAEVARRLLDAEGADLVVVVSGPLYEDVVSSGGKFIHPTRYASVTVPLKEGEVTAWCQVPGRPAPVVPAPVAGPSVTDSPPPGSPPLDSPAGDPPSVDPSSPVPGSAGPRSPGPSATGPARGAVAGARGAYGDGVWPAEPEAEDGDELGTGPADVRYTVHGDLSQHHDNVYHQPVHIGRTTRDAGPRKG